MPAAAKAPLNSKNPATVAKKIYAGGGIVGNGGHGEVVCPLFNADGSICRKKCVGNFAYRSICEHIRRAHPDNWIPKLPASPETFAKMVNLPSRGLSANAVNAQFHMRKPQHVPATSTMPVFRKTGKALSRHEDEQYADGMSPSSSANESETLPSISLSTNPVAFQSKFPAAISDYEEHDDGDHDFMEEDDPEEEMRPRRSDIDTEDDSEDGRHNSHRRQLLHHHSHHRNHLQSQLPPLRTGSKPSTSLKRKRQPYATSNPETGAITDSSSTQSSAISSRWDELIEAATNRAVAIDPKPFHHHHSHHHQYSHTPQTPLSPPATASSSYPSLAPTASPPSTLSSDFTPMSGPRKLLCATCEGLTPIHEAFACTECMSGFCGDCAFNSGRRRSCGECRAVGGKFKPLRIVVR